MFRQVTFKTYPNKWKAKNPKQPDIRGTVEVTDMDGVVHEFDYAQWKPGPGKSQTLTLWKPKQPKQEDSDPADEHGQPNPPKENRPNTPPPSATVKDDAEGW